MPRKVFDQAIRINVSIEKKLHAAAVARADELRLKGGVSEYIARLLNGSLARDPSHVLKLPHYFSPKRVRA